jgi:hypothetical protein
VAENIAAITSFNHIIDDQIEIKLSRRYGRSDQPQGPGGEGEGTKIRDKFEGIVCLARTFADSHRDESF